MLIPTTYAATIVLLVFALLCWGSWANTLKQSKWRFELYYIDFSLGAVIAAVVLAFTVGSMGTEISVQDNFLLSGKKQILYAFIAGCVFNLANMLLVAAIDLIGMSIAFPVAMGLALIVGVGWNYFMLQTGSVPALAVGCVLLLIAVIMASIAQGKMAAIRSRFAAEKLLAETPVESVLPAKKKRSDMPAGPSAYLGVWIAVIGGLLLGAFYPIAATSMEGELGFSNPLAVTLVASIGILLSTIIYNLYFMNLPVRGLPISFFAYFTGTLKQHALGMAGGLLWMAGTCAAYSASLAQADSKATPTTTYAITQAATLLSVFWGLWLWKEFADADSGVKRQLAIMLALFIAGIALVAIAPLY